MCVGGGGDVLMFHAITISFLFSNCGSQTSANENGTSHSLKKLIIKDIDNCNGQVCFNCYNLFVDT